MERTTENQRDEIKETELKPADWHSEVRHLKFSVEVIERNIELYTAKLEKIGVDTKELYDNYRSENPALHSDLGVNMDLMFLDKRTLQKNLAAQMKPYFGRIDYYEQDDKKEVKLYIGKNGISRGGADIVIVDWRAPVASVYYDSDIGESYFMSPFDERIKVYLNLKRTFEIYETRLIDYYDTDVISNDEFLTKYLGKNKEAVLGEIIATIQKEQNEIIRDTPWHNIVVQGVAGSGKTTVAMHRISYILYNFKDKFHPSEFFIIGSNKMLLRYITGVLPNLDVFGVNQMALMEFLEELLGKSFDYRKRKYNISQDFIKASEEEHSDIRVQLKKYKASLHIIEALEYYLHEYEWNFIKKDPVYYGSRAIYTKDDMTEAFGGFKDIPLQDKIDLMNKRLTSRLKLRMESDGIDTKSIREEVKKYKNYFGKPKQKFDIMEIYDGFLNNLLLQREVYQDMGIMVPEKVVLELLFSDLTKRNLDIYDMAVLAYLKKRIIACDDFDYVSHIIIDEAQDFGINIFYIMKQLFKNCTYTIMGDVTQNIHYDTGLNDWEELNQKVFSPAKDRFYSLAKSYRNTVEISNYASGILKHCSFKTYDIEPIIRHGNPVTVQEYSEQDTMTEEAAAIIQSLLTRGYDTIAVICRDEWEAKNTLGLLGRFVEVQQHMENMEDMTFTHGVMVLPIHMTKGLEFDAVILWNPIKESYEASDAHAKLLYVAVTRALHELYILYRGQLSELLELDTAK